MEKITDVTYRMKRVHRDSDAVWRIFVVVRHHHDTILIPTELYATEIELTKNNRLGNGPLMADCRRITRRYQRRLASLRLDTYDIDTGTVAAILRGDLFETMIQFLQIPDQAVNLIKIRHSFCCHSTSPL